MNKITAILVDDERIARARLRRLLEAEADLEIIAECANGADTIEVVRERVPDLIFLDINMPGLNGFDVLESLGPDHQPRVVIFVTAYDEHAVRAFEACALDYLLKPVAPERLAKSLQRARALLASPHTIATPQAPPPGAQRFVIRNGGRVSFVAPGEVKWVEAAGNYAILHCGLQNHMVRETMNSLESQLPPPLFMRVSRSAIVNLSAVQSLEASASGDLAILTDGQRVNVTRNLREIADRVAQVCPNSR